MQGVQGQVQGQVQGGQGVQGVVEWFYRDDQGQLQGPFSTQMMRSWHVAGYFHPDLLLRVGSWAVFHSFRVVFPEFNIAFLSTP
ncbi:GYF domain-containing protein, partial [Ochromonadaceae sp. CCMP2298]